MDSKVFSPRTYFVCLSQLFQILLIPRHEEEEGIKCKTEKYLKHLHRKKGKYTIPDIILQIG